MIFTYYPNKESYQPSYFLIWELPQLLTSGTTRESFEGFKSGRITKEQLPIIIASGQVEPGRKTNDNVRYHSGVIMLDLDRKDNPDIENKIRYINNDRFTYLSFSSPNHGYKVCIYTSIEDVKEHAGNSIKIVAKGQDSRSQAHDNIANLTYAAIGQSLLGLALLQG